MNSDLYENGDVYTGKYLCKDTNDEATEPEIVAEWSGFKYYLDADGKPNSDTHKKLQESSLNIYNDDDNSNNQDGITLEYVCDDAVLKMVAGPDSVVGALGSAAVDGAKSGGCHFAINGLSTAAKKYTITKVEFSVFGDERTINYSYGTTNKSYLSDSEWKTTEIEMEVNETSDIKDVIIWPSAQTGNSTNPNDYKVMRIDNIKVWGTPN